MTALLEIVKNQPVEGFTEKLLYGGQMLLIGMATVFAVLTLLWACLVVFKVVFHDIPANRKREASEKRVDTAATVVQPEPINTNNDDEIIAVIAAAIAAAESECSGLKFKVVSFKRK